MNIEERADGQFVGYFAGDKPTALEAFELMKAQARSDLLKHPEEAGPRRLIDRIFGGRKPPDERLAEQRKEAVAGIGPGTTCPCCRAMLLKYGSGVFDGLFEPVNVPDLSPLTSEELESLTKQVKLIEKEHGL